MSKQPTTPEELEALAQMVKKEMIDAEDRSLAKLKLRIRELEAQNERLMGRYGRKAYEERIAELEAEVERLTNYQTQLQAEIDEMGEEIEHLSVPAGDGYEQRKNQRDWALAWVARAEAAEKATEHYKDLAEVAEAKLRAVGSLMASWRERDFDLPPYTKGVMDGRHQCAEELEALLKGDT